MERIRSSNLKIISIFLSFLIITVSVLISIIATTFSPTAQAAGTVVKDLPNGAPKQGIIIDDMTKFYTIKPVFSTTKSAFQFCNGSPQWSWLPASDASKGYSVKYNGTTASSGTISGNFTLRWNNIAKDSSGNAIDIVLRVSNFRATAGTQPVLINIRPNGEIWSCAVTAGGGNAKNWFDCEFFFYKRGTDTGTDSAATMQFRDLDVWKPETWDESVRLLANYDSTLHIIPDTMKIPGAGQDKAGCWLVIETLSTNPTFRAREGYTDNDTLHTGFCVAAKNGFKFSWWGQGCATIINDFYGQHKIVASKGSGGTITSEGTTIVPWKHDKTYTAAASTNYKIKSITVDGSPISITNQKTMNYSFTSVIADHTINVQFEPIKVNLTYDKNLSAATGSTTGTSNVNAGTSVTIASSGFTAPRYHFTGWNTKPDGTGTKYTPGSTLVMPESNITLYAQWELDSYTITESHTEGGTVSPAGTTTVKYGENCTYNIQADTSSKIVSITVDGAPVAVDDEKQMSYVFSSIDKDHTIHIEFSKLPAKLIYNADAPSEEISGTMPDKISLAGDKVIIDENAFLRPGYTFTGWSAISDEEWNVQGGASSGEQRPIIFPGDEITLNLEGNDTILYAVWEKNPILTVKVTGHGIASAAAIDSGIELALGETTDNEESTYMLQPGNDARISWRPSDAWWTEKVVVDGTEIDLKQTADNGMLETITDHMFENMHEDHAIEIIFSPMFDMPQTGSAGNLIFALMGMTTIIFAILISIRTRTCSHRGSQTD